LRFRGKSVDIVREEKGIPGEKEKSPVPGVLSGLGEKSGKKKKQNKSKRGSSQKVQGSLRREVASLDRTC